MQLLDYTLCIYLASGDSATLFSKVILWFSLPLVSYENSCCSRCCLTLVLPFKKKKKNLLVVLCGCVVLSPVVLSWIFLLPMIWIPFQMFIIYLNVHFCEVPVQVICHDSQLLTLGQAFQMPSGEMWLSEHLDTSLFSFLSWILALWVLVTSAAIQTLHTDFFFLNPGFLVDF